MSIWDVQVAVMQVLNADATLPPVLDSAEPKPEMPYGTYGTPTSTKRGLFGKRFTSDVVILDWWGKAKTLDRIHGNKQVAEAADRARVLLDGKPIALASGRMVSLRWESEALVGDPDPNIRHLQQRYRVGVTE